MSGKKSAVGAYEAKTHFSQLLERVVAGEEITITRHGHAVARLVPIAATPSVESRREAVRQMRELACRNHLKGLRIRDLMTEGRK